MDNSLRELTLQIDQLQTELASSVPDLDSLAKGVTAAQAHAARATARDRKLTAAAMLFEDLAAGEDLIQACVDSVRAMLTAKQALEARSFAGHLASVPQTREAGLLCAGVVAVKGRLIELAGSYLDLVPATTVLRYASPEWYEVAFHRDADAALQYFTENPDDRPETVASIVKLCLSHGRTSDALPLLRRHLAAGRSGGASVSQEAQFMGRYFDRRAKAALAASTANIPAPRLGVWDFSTPDRSQPPANIGGHLESLAWLACLARIPGITVQATDPDVSDVFNRLRDTKCHGDLDGAGSRPVSLVTVPRFAPDGTDVPHGTWTIHHGLFGSRVFGARQRLPLAPAIHPIFVGWSVDNPSELSEDDLQALRSFGPVGCREPATVSMLLALGVDAFLSGPLTSLLGIFADPELLRTVAESDFHEAFLPLDDAKSGVSVFRHAGNALREESAGRNLSTGLSYLSALARSGSVQTAGAETAAAAFALGSTVDYRPLGSPSPQPVLPRSSGPYDPARETAALLTAALELIVAGASPEDIYSAWRKAAAPLVSASRADFSAAVAVPDPLFDIASVLGELRAAKVSRGKASGTGAEVHVAMASDDRLFGQLAVAINSLRSTTSRPLTIHLLTRSVMPEDFDWIAALFPDVGFEFFACDSVAYGDSLSRSSHITVSTLDRLLLPSLLTGVDQVLYLDADLMAVSDVGLLADVKLTQHSIAACTATADWARDGVGHILAVAKRMSADRAAELVKALAQQGEVKFEAFNAGVLVLNLQKMREDGFCERFLGYPSRYGLNDQEVLFCYAGANTRRLQPSWNSIPSHSYVSEPRVIHWAGPAKPWGRLRVPYQSAWLKALADLRVRALRAGLAVDHLDAAVRMRKSAPW